MLADAYEIILGEDWLCKYSALCLGATGPVCLPRVGRESRWFVVLTAVQAEKALASGCRASLAVCTDAQPVIVCVLSVFAAVY